MTDRGDARRRVDDAAADTSEYVLLPVLLYTIGADAGGEIGIEGDCFAGRARAVGEDHAVEDDVDLFVGRLLDAA